MSAGEVSLLTRFKCQTLGHDWYYRRSRENRKCARCGVTEPYSVEETHGDEGAEKGQTRFVIDDGNLEIQQYQCTGHGPNAEHWQWFPTGYGEATEENLIQLKQDIEGYLRSDEEE